MPSQARYCVAPQQALVFIATFLWFVAVRSSLAQCTEPIIRTVAIDDVSSRITVTLVNTSAPTPSLALYYLNATGNFTTITPQNGSGGLQFAITGPVPQVVAVAMLDSGTPAAQTPEAGRIIASRQAVIIVRPSASSGSVATFVEAFGNASCTGQGPLYMSGTSGAVKLCELVPGKPQYVVVSGSQSLCPKVVINELSVGPAGQYVELYVEGGSDVDLSGFSLAFFNASSNSSVFVTRLNRRTNSFGFATINVTTVVPERAVVAVYDRLLSGTVPLNLSESSNRTGIVAALVFGKGSAADGLKDKQVLATLTLFTGTAQAVWLGQSQSNPLSLSYCSSGTSSPARFILSPPTPEASNNCTGVLASTTRSILRINEFNADIHGPETWGNITEYVELLANVLTANTSLANYYIVLYRGSTTLAYRVFPLDSVFISSEKRFVLIGTIDVCGRSCDVTMPGDTIVNGIGAIALHYREEGPINIGWPASQDGLVDAYVYKTSDRTLASDEAVLARLLGFSEGTSHVIFEDENAFVLDESVGLCEGDVMQLMPLTPGSPNDCSLSLSGGRSVRTAADAGLTSLVYINEWQPTADGRSEHVELVGSPGTAIGRLRLLASAWNVSTGAVNRISFVLALSGDARLSPAGLYSLSAVELSRLTIAAAASGSEASTAYGNGSRLAYRLTLAAVSNATGSAVWQSREILIPLDAVAVAAPADALLRPGGELVPLDLGSSAASSPLLSWSASRCRLNASAPASSAANGPDFDARPVTRNATNACPLPMEVLINEVTVRDPASLDYIELIIRGANASVATSSLSGFVLVYWNGSDGTVAASVGLAQRLPRPGAATEQIVVVEGFARPTAVTRYVLALYYDYDFLYPLGAAVATSSRLVDSIGFSTDIRRPPLSDYLVDTFRLLYPSDSSTFYAQGVVTMVDSSRRSLSRCPSNSDHAADAFEPADISKGLLNKPCEDSRTAPRGRESITVQHCLQRKFLRIGELAISASGSGFVELTTADPSATPGLPLADLQLVFYWASGNGSSTSSGWSVLNSSIAQPLGAYFMPTNGSSYLVVSLTTFNSGTATLPAFRDAAVLCAALLFDDRRYYDGHLPVPPAQLNASALFSELEERFVDAIAAFVGNASATTSVPAATWPLTPGYAPLTSDGGLFGTASFSRCYSMSTSRANAAFAATAVLTPGAANYCPPPPVRLYRLCVTGGQTVTLVLESAVAQLPLERLRVVAYTDPLQAATAANGAARATTLTFAADAVSSADPWSATATASIVPQQANYSFLAAAVFFYPPNVTMSSGAPSLLLTGNPTPLLQKTVHAVMLHGGPGDGVWERVAELLNIRRQDVPLVPPPKNTATVCVTGCRTAAGEWTVRDVGMEYLKTDACPAQQWESVLINEIDADQPGLDSYEFIELIGPSGMDASSYAIEITNRQIPYMFQLEGKFNKDGFFVIGTAKVPNCDMPLPVEGLIPNDGGAVALYRVNGPVQGTGLQDVVAFANSAAAAQEAMKQSRIAEKYPWLVPSFLIEDATAYNGKNASLSRCFCNTTVEHSCFALSLLPTPGTQNFCVRRDQPLQLKFCLDRPVAQVDPAAVKTALASAIDSNCSCAFSEHQLSDMKQCDTGVQFDAFGTTTRHLDAIRRGFAAAIGRDLLAPNSTRIAQIYTNCSLSCPVESPQGESSGSNGGVVAGVVVSALLLIAAGGVAVYWIRKRRVDRGFQMARFDGAFEDDDAFAGDNASGRVTFSNPFRPSSTERRQYMKL